MAYRLGRPRAVVGPSIRTSPIPWLTLPAWLLIVGVLAVPIAWGAVLSIQDYGLGNADPSRFVGLDNYATDVISPVFLDALVVTTIITVLGIAVQLPMGFVLALALNRELAGTRLFRSALLMPMMLTPVAVGLMWRFMLNTDLGVIDWFLRQTLLPAPDWLGNRTAALAAILLVDAWQSVPFVMIVLLAGLKSLPSSPFEAARVDGATAFQTLRWVTLPLLAPAFLVVLLIRVIEGVKLFDIIFIVTQGGPGAATQSLSVLDYRTGFTFFATSRAAAIGVVLALMLAPAYWLWIRAAKQ